MMAEPIIDKTVEIDRLITKQGDDNVELLFKYPKAKVVSSLDDINETGVYSGTDIFDPTQYENQ